MFGFFKKSRKAANKAFGMVRAFVAAEVNAILSPWKYDGGFSNTEVATALSTMRNHSRDMQKNSELYARWLGLFVANVVGDVGFTFIPKPVTKIGETDVDTKNAYFLKYHFWKWATNPKFSDVTGRKTFAAIARLIAENWARDGEGIIYVDTHAQNPYGIALRVIRPDALDENMNQETVAGTSNRAIRNGVEIDKNTLRPTAYYFKTSAEDSASYSFNGSGYMRIEADKVIHVFTQHDECQTRGIPLGHAVLRKLKMLDEYNFAEICAARDEANTVGYYHAPAGRESEIARLNEDKDSSTYLCQKSEPLQRYVLPPGWEFETKTPQHPNRELVAFKNSMIRDIACGLNLEYANFSNDWAGVSFSSVRVGTLAERDYWRVQQMQMIEQFATPIFYIWLKSFLGLAASGTLKAADFDRLSEHEFRGRRWDWVDPMKDINASILAVQHGWKTNEQVAADYGGDYYDNLKDLEAEKKAAEDAGLAPPAQIPEPIKDTDKD